MVYVEYLQNGNEGSKGTGWGIDLGFTPSSGNIKMKCKTYFPNSNQDGTLFIGTNETKNDFFRFFSYNSQGMVFDCPTDNGNGRVGPLAYTGVTEWEMAISVNDNTNSTYLKNLTNNTIVSKTNTYTWTHSKQFKVWDTNSQITQGTQVYWIEIYQDDVKVREYVPALDNNRVPCLYEKLNGTYHYNTGNTLTVGPILSSIIVTPSKTNLASTGETITIDVVTENAWSVTGNTWLTLSSTGDTGVTTITATAPSYTGTTKRSDTLTFTDSETGDEMQLIIYQKKYTDGVPFYLGENEVTEAYLGDIQVTEAYLGEELVFES